MKILRAVRKIPGGMMVVPLMLGALTNTFFPQIFELGGFTEALLKTGSTAILAVFLFCNGAQISVRQAGPTLYKGTALLLVKFIIGAVLGVLVNSIFGTAGVLAISPLAIIAALTNSNGGLYAALAGEYGDSSDVGVVSIISINDGPFLTMLAFGITGLAAIPFSALLATLIPILLGFVLGNIDTEIQEFLEPGTWLLIPFFAFPLGAGLNFGQLITAGLPGILLGVASAVLTGVGGYYAFKLIKADHPEVGAAIGTTAGNAVATPAALALIDPNMAEVAQQATAQVAAAIIVTAILCPLIVNFFHKRESKKRHRVTAGAN